jgi:hypothetical protein
MFFYCVEIWLVHFLHIPLIAFKQNRLFYFSGGYPLFLSVHLFPSFCILLLLPVCLASCNYAFALPVEIVLSLCLHILDQAVQFIMS